MSLLLLCLPVGAQTVSPVEGQDWHVVNLVLREVEGELTTPGPPDDEGTLFSLGLTLPGGSPGWGWGR